MCKCNKAYNNGTDYNDGITCSRELPYLNAFIFAFYPFNK